MTNITPIRQEPEDVANCPECRSKYWFVRLDNVNDNWQNIIGTECADCGFFVEWVRATVQADTNHE